MPLELFAIIVPLGIALIVLAVKFSGLSKSAVLTDSKQAIEVFEADYGGETHKGRALLSANGDAAFIPLAEPSRLGLVEAIGDRYICRVLGPEDLKSVTGNQDNGFEIRYNDFTHPRGQYSFTSSKDMETLKGWLSQLAPRSIDFASKYEGNGI